MYKAAKPMRALKVMIKCFSIMRLSIGKQRSSLKRCDACHASPSFEEKGSGHVDEAEERDSEHLRSPL